MPYTISVYTGDVKNADTKSKVFIELFGEHRDESSGRIKLTDGEFKRGKIDRLTIDVPKMLSPLSRVLIGHDNSGGDWFLDRVDVECPMIGMKQVFPCGKWFSKEVDDGRIERILKEDTSLREIRKSQAVWNVWVYTSNLKYAGTVLICFSLFILRYFYD